ncbi:unnamed protein product [Paramecium primaurelia]|uniref:Uncharacterized protein n=1 Tax=Paramecium primaurelia TaxID=5886 RepID=A0A8S1QI96_PARPR|nr:unnamed protein product [Paramecium primaurelia]
MRSFISKNRVVFLTSIGVVGFCAYYMKMSFKEKYNVEKLFRKHDQHQYLDKYDRSIDQKLKTNNDIKIRYIGDHFLEAKLLIKIYGKQLDIAGDAFRQLSKLNWILRRNLMRQNQQSYVDCIVQFIMDVENILDQALIRSLYELDVPKEKFEESVLARMDQEYFQHLYMFKTKNQINQENKFKKNEGHYSIQCTDAQEFPLRISRYSTSNYIIKRLQKQIQKNLMLIPTLINLIIQDKIYSQFGVEEEDQTASLKNVQGDKEIQNLLKRGQIEMSRLLKKIKNQIPKNLENVF